MTTNKPVESKLYSEDYYAGRCGGFEFTNKFGFQVLKPSMMIALLKAEIQPDFKMLDLGCGRGELVAHLSAKGFDIVGVDYSEEAIKFARSLYPEGRFLLADVNELPFPKGSFDRIFLLGTIEHLTDTEIERSLSAVFGLLKLEGKLIVTTCTNRLYYKTNTYHMRRKMSEIASRLGFHINSPSPPRSDEDLQLHINEQNYFSLRKKFKLHSGDFRVIPLPNPKIYGSDVYTENLVQDLPLKVKPRWKKWMYEKFVFRFPLNLFLARSYVISATKTQA